MRQPRSSGPTVCPLSLKLPFSSLAAARRRRSAVSNGGGRQMLALTIRATGSAPRIMRESKFEMLATLLECGGPGIWGMLRPSRAEPGPDP
jgi:hypothetical protein